MPIITLIYIDQNSRPVIKEIDSFSLYKCGELTFVVIASAQMLLSLSEAVCGFTSQILAGLSLKFPNLLCGYLIGWDFSSLFKMRGWGFSPGFPSYFL